MEQLLATKLFVPSNRPELVTRSRLINQLNEGLHRKLTLISALAGFGKTTLVSEWVDTLQKDNDKENRIAWLSLDEGDNSPVRFLTYFVTALNQMDQIVLAGFSDGAMIALDMTLRQEIPVAKS